MLKLIIGFLTGICSTFAFATNVPISISETIVDDEGKTHEVRYTPYYALDYFDEETGILCRTFVTLGDERLPTEYKKDYKKTSKNMFKNAELVYAVAETYFYNYSDKPITITPLSFTWLGALSEKPLVITNSQITVPPQSQAITPPIVDHAFYLQREFTIEFELLIDDKKHIMKGQVKRLTPEDIKKMYGQ
jgi:hypothetical protein